MPKVYTNEELRSRTAVDPLKDLNPASQASMTKLYHEARAAKVTPSGYLEMLDPSTSDDTTDAFERQLMVRGIRTTTIKEKGIYADKIDRFYASNQPDTVVLFPEYINRTVRMANLGYDNLEQFIAVHTPITGSGVYESIYVDTTQLDTFRMKRVAESSEIPRAKLTFKPNPIKLKKYGIAMEGSYEVFRRMQIDFMNIHLQMVAEQNRLDKMAAVADVIINGDGNSNPAVSTNATSLDSGLSAGQLSYPAWMKWIASFYPRQLTTIGGSVNTIVDILTMTFPGGDPLLLLAQFADRPDSGLKVQVSPGVFTNITLCIIPGLADGTIVGVDKTYGIEEINEVGSDLVETDKIIMSQVNEIAISEVNAYAKLYPQASRVLVLA